MEVPSSTPCWSNIVKKQPPAKQEDGAVNRVFESCKSSKGIAVAVVDANAIIQGGEKLTNCADKFVSVSEVMEEVRDPVSRHRLAFVPFTVETMEPSSEALKKVINFARATGDLQTLSDVDLKLIALTYTLEAQIHGTKHLRDSPPPVHVVNVKRLAENEMPGWGSNVPNLEEWEALEHAAEVGTNSDSRILPLKDLNLNFIPMEEPVSLGDGVTDNGCEGCAKDEEEADHSLRKPRKYMPKKKEINIEGRKMVSDGIDASRGQGDDNSGDWLPAVSRTTHRRYLRRKARRELSDKDGQSDVTNVPEGSGGPDQLLHGSTDGISEECDKTDGKFGDDNLSYILEHMRLEERSSEHLLEENELSISSAKLEDCSSVVEIDNSNEANIPTEGETIETCHESMDQLEISSQGTESIEAPFFDDSSSENSWMLQSLSESSVACVTSDFAMQNVILQIGLRLLAPGGMQIRQLHRWILKCHACNKVTAEIGRIFCPKCGNGGTLRKVAVTVDGNGIVLAARRPRIVLRGTKFSLPLPQGGRDAITKNLILREDQLPQKLLYPKTKKKASKQGDDLFTSDDIFGHNADKRAPLKPPIRQALAIFSGKRNPNDNHFSRSRSKR